MAGDKELKVKISGDASQLGAESRKAVGLLNEIKGAANSLISGFTGGLLGGGVAGGIAAAVNMVAEQIRDARRLMSEARNMEVSSGFLRGARAVSEYLTGQESVITSSIENATQTRSNAVFGDPNAEGSMTRLGVRVQDIAGLSKEELFSTLVAAFRSGPDTRDRRAALADFFGENQVNRLLPYLVGKGGKQVDFDSLIKSQSLPSWMLGPLLRELPNRSGFDSVYRGDAEPISRAGLGDENRAARLRSENDQRALAVKRSQLSIEEQITAVAAQRAELEARMNAETDVVKKERLRSDLISLDAEKVRLDQESARAVRPSAAHQSFTPQADEFAQRGMFIGGQQRVPGILERQLAELQAVVREIREGRRDNKDIWG